jgi:hypothetical protein
MHKDPIVAALITTILLLSGCHSTAAPAVTAINPTTPVTDACAVLTPAEISEVLGVPIDPGQHIPKASTIMCGWAKTGVVGDSIVMLNFTKPDYFEKERDPQPRITMTPAPGIADDAYYITSQFGTSLIIKKGSTVIGLAVRDKSIPSVQLMEKERALGLKAASRL